MKSAYPPGRWANAPATPEPQARCPDAVPFELALAADELLAHLRTRLPAADVPRVVVSDNAGIRTSKTVQAARPGPAQLGSYLYDLPAPSLALNRIEPVFEQVQHRGMPTRSFTTRADLLKAVEGGFDTHRRRLRANGDTELPRAAAVSTTARRWTAAATGPNGRARAAAGRFGSERSREAARANKLPTGPAEAVPQPQSERSARAHAPPSAAPSA